MTKEELYYLPASELLKYIQAEKDRLVKEKAIKKSKQLPVITDEEKPYDLPKGWEWVRLGEIIDYKNGFAFSKKHMNEDGEGIPVLKSQNIMTKKVVISKKTDRVSNLSDKMKGHFVYKNDLLMVLSSQSSNVEPLGITAIYELDSPSLVNQRVLKMSSIVVNTKYLYYALNSPDFHYLLSHKASGSAQANLKLDHVLEMALPLPPLYIQDQIVQKLEKLSETRDSLLVNSESQFNYTKKMREALWQEAIRGELVTQNENDEPASILLDKIKTEKDSLVKGGIIKKTKVLPQITAEEIPYELPFGWEWVRLGEVITLSDNLNIQSNLNPEDRINYLDIDSIDNSNQTIKGVKIEPVKNLSTRARRVLKKDMIVYSMVRPYLKNMAIITEDKENYIGSTGFIAFNSIFVKKEYIFNFLRSDYTTNILNSYITGFNSPSINMDQFNELLFPLPPLAEQERIIAKLDE